MTKHISNTLGLPLLEDALRDAGMLPAEVAQDDTDLDTTPDQEEEIEQASVSQFEAAEKRLADVSGQDHERAMDTLYREGLDNARQLFDLAMNMDHARARGIFEQSANFYKIALDSKNSKRDRQLKAIQIAQDQKKIELAEQKMKADTGDKDPSKSDVLVVEDRNELIRRMRAQLKNS